MQPISINIKFVAAKAKKRVELFKQIVEGNYKHPTDMVEFHKLDTQDQTMILNAWGKYIGGEQL